MRVSLPIRVLFVASLVLASCAGPKEAADETPETTVALEDVETFDPAPYQIDEDEMLEETFELTHRVPGALMEPSDSSRGSYTESMVIRSGYRIQIFSGEDKSNADDRLQQALTWWENEGGRLEGADSIFSDSLPIRIVYNAPYYKVRIGDFVDRQEAQKSLTLIRQRFPDAWIVPDQVEVRQ